MPPNWLSLGATPARAHEEIGQEAVRETLLPTLDQTKSTGDVEILKDLSNSIRDKHVIVVEDIIDTGLTLHRLLQILGVNQDPAAKKRFARKHVRA